MPSRPGHQQRGEGRRGATAGNAPRHAWPWGPSTEGGCSRTGCGPNKARRTGASKPGIRPLKSGEGGRAQQSWHAWRMPPMKYSAIVRQVGICRLRTTCFRPSGRTCLTVHAGVRVAGHRAGMKVGDASSARCGWTMYFLQLVGLFGQACRRFQPSSCWVRSDLVVVLVDLHAHPLHRGQHFERRSCGRVASGSREIAP